MTMASIDHTQPSPSKRMRTGALTSVGRPLSNIPALLLEQQLDSLQAELDHERSLRKLDQRRAQQQKELLEQNVEFAVKEANNAKTMLNEFRAESQTALQKMRDARDNAFSQVRQLQMELIHAGEENGHDDGYDAGWKSEYQRLKEVTKLQKQQEQELIGQVSKLKKEVEVLTERRNDSNRPDTTPLIQEAPSDLMSELQRVRIKLAETERSHRQLERSYQNLEQRNKTLVVEREQAQSQGGRLPLVKASLDSLQKEHEVMKSTHKAWKRFGDKLLVQMQSTSHFTAPAKVAGELALPPEVSTVLRVIESTKNDLATAQKECAKYRNTCDEMRKEIGDLKKQMSDQPDKERAWEKEKANLEEKLESAQGELALSGKKNSILQREINSLQELVKTLDDLPLAGSKASSKEQGAVVETLKLSLKTKAEEIQMLQQEANKLKQNLEEAQSKTTQASDELDKVKAKFMKLRDALHAERAKAEEAQARANEAEALAGKGSFDPSRTRVLHFQETPLVQALREEVQVLKRQLDAGVSTNSKLAPDPDKLNQRLKQNFKEQIALFREGVHLMTGLKIDMIPGSERPTFRVRSMFAEREEDHLLLKWPKGGQEVKSLDILGTDFAKALSTTPSYQYMTKFHSLPGFLASMQLTLLENQTVM